jgi:hypothetical protein
MPNKNKRCHSGKIAFSALAENAILSGLLREQQVRLRLTRCFASCRFGFLPKENQIGSPINFLSPYGEEKILRNDAGFKVTGVAQ